MHMRSLLYLACASGFLATPLGAQESKARDLLGDPLPAGALARMGTSRLRSDTTVSCVAFAVDGKSLVAAGYSNRLTWWDLASGQELRKVTLATVSSVNAMQFSRDGKVLALACGDGSVRLLDGESAVERRALVDTVNRYSTITMSLSPDGKSVVVVHRHNRLVVLWNAETGVVRHRIPNVNTYNLPAVVFTPDSKKFVTLWTDSKLHLVDVETGKSLKELEPAATTTGAAMYASRIPALAVTPDGKKVVYRTMADRFFNMVDLETGKRVFRWEKTGPAGFYSSNALAVTPNGRFLVEAGSESSVKVWGLASGKLLRELPGGAGAMQTVAVSRDGKRVASASGNAVYLWDLATSRRLHGGGGHQSSVMRLAFTPDGKQLVSAGGSSMRVWDAGSGRELHVLGSVPAFSISHLSPTRGGKAVRWVGSDQALYRWTFGDADRVRLTSPRSRSPVVLAQAVSPDGKVLAAINAGDRKLRLVDLLGNKPDRELVVVPNAYANLLTFSPDGRTLALVTTNDRVVTLFDVVEGTEVRKLMPVVTPGRSYYATSTVTFAPDGRSLVKFDGELRVIETATGGQRLQLPHDVAVAPSQLAWSDNGRLVARAQTDGVVTVHDTHTGKEVLRKHTGQGAVYALAFSPDGRRLASGGANTTILVWQVPEAPAVRPTLEEEAAWRALEDSDASRAFAALAFLASQPEDTLRLFKARLKPRPPADAKRIDKLVQDLDDDAPAVRDKASEELAEIGLPAQEALKKAEKSGSLEVRRRAEDLLRKLKGGSGVAPERLRAQRAVEVLERIGTPAAVAALKGMLRGKLDAALEASIRGSLRRLGAADR
jgi:WD40 repeat protein